MQKKEKKWITWFGSIGTVCAILMYVSYISQIINNLHGHYGAPLQPFVAFINCTIWCVYSYFKADRDWFVFWSNFPGIFFGLATFITDLH